jgi:amino acid adenylation domain-containing protein
VRVERLLAQRARLDPNKTAIVCEGSRYSYGWIQDEVERRAGALLEGGLRAGERVAICLDTSVDAVVWLFAVLRAGGAFVFVSPRSPAPRVAAVVDDCDAAAIVSRTRNGRADVTWRSHGEDVDPDLAALIYTSGSTGAPKGVMLTHGNILFAARAIAAYLGNRPDDVVLSALPISFTYGLSQITTLFLVGGTVVLEKSFAYPRQTLDTMRREHVTGLPLVPTMATLLLQQAPSYSLPALRYMTNAAAALAPEKIQRLRARFPGVQLYSMYGLTECQRASFLPPAMLDTQPASVGRALPGTEAAVVDDHDDETPAGAVGELVVQGPHVMKGYWKQPVATASALRRRGDGRTWLYTGDLFTRDEEGLLHFVERRDSMIKTRGEKVAPRAVEQVIARLQGVSEVAVFGVPDELLGEAVVAVVTVAPGCSMTSAEIRRHCDQQLDSFMVPKVVDIRAQLPTTTSGKISRLALRSLALQQGVDPGVEQGVAR